MALTEPVNPRAWLAIAYGVALALVGFWGSPVDAAGKLPLSRVARRRRY